MARYRTHTHIKVLFVYYVRLFVLLSLRSSRHHRSDAQCSNALASNGTAQYGSRRCLFRRPRVCVWWHHPAEEQKARRQLRAVETSTAGLHIQNSHRSLRCWNRRTAMLLSPLGPRPTLQSTDAERGHTSRTGEQKKQRMIPPARTSSCHKSPWGRCPAKPHVITNRKARRRTRLGPGPGELRQQEHPRQATLRGRPVTKPTPIAGQP